MRNDTIVAVATPPGFGGVAIIRLSGKKALAIGEKITHKKLVSRKILFSKFYAEDNSILDEGVVLFFENPNSYTGEDVVELQGHGSPVVAEQLIKLAIKYGASIAKPGEFTERAFLNDKLDLVQAEAVADLIHATSFQAAKSAIASLQGVFSAQINQLSDALVQLRVFVEATLDFPDEEIDFIQEEKVQGKLTQLLQQIEIILLKSKEGHILRDGMKVVLIGKPNVGKSSLLNALSGREPAIVTDIPGTTRDIIRETILLDGLPVHVIDTAGFRDGCDKVEQEGIRRAQKEVLSSDAILFLVDAREENYSLDALWSYHEPIPKSIPVILVRNKCDLIDDVIGQSEKESTVMFNISAKNGEGLDVLKAQLKSLVGFKDAEGVILARQRHINALENTRNCILNAMSQLQEMQAIELAAEELRLAHKYLGEIVGVTTADDLLGEIFSTFCIGK